MGDKTGDKLGDKPREVHTSSQTSWKPRERQARGGHNIPDNGGHTKKAIENTNSKLFGKKIYEFVSLSFSDRLLTLETPFSSEA